MNNNYKIILESLACCVVEEFDTRERKLKHYYKLKSNQLILKIIENEDFTLSYDFSFEVIKRPYRPSVYLESAIVELYEEIVKNVSNYKKIFKKRKNVLLTIMKVK